MNKDVFDEVEKMLNDAIGHIHDCERWNGRNDGRRARALIIKVKQKLGELKKESDD